MITHLNVNIQYKFVNEVKKTRKEIKKKKKLT